MSTTVYLDLETGGLQPHHPIIQIAAVAVDDGTLEELATFERKIAFDVAKADPEALTMNHYSDAAWEGCLQPVAVAHALSAFAKPYLCVQRISQRGMPYSLGKLAGYNAITFDAPRLKAFYAGEFFPFSYQIRDVLQRVLWWFDETGLTPPADFKLATVAQYFGVSTDGAHDALSDVRMTIALAKALRSERIEL